MSQNQNTRFIRVTLAPKDNRSFYYMVDPDVTPILIAKFNAKSFTNMFGNAAADCMSPQQFVDWLEDTFADRVKLIIPDISKDLAL